MMRSGIALCLFAVACGGRPAGSVDSAVERSRSVDARPPVPERPPDAPIAPRACTSLKVVAQASLELADTMKLGPQIVFDGEGFALVWHSQSSLVSSLIGELRFARVDLAGTPSSQGGVSLGTDDGSLRAGLAAGMQKYAIVHQPTTGVPGVELRQVDRTAKTLSVAHVEGSFKYAAIAPHPLGHALLLAGWGGNPQLVVVQDKAGPPPAAKQIPTAQIMASVWLAARPKGFAAALFTTNSNGMLFLLDPDLGVVAQGSVGHGALITSPSFTIRADGTASVYGNGTAVESEVYEASGKATDHHTLATAASLSGSEHTAVTWTEKELLAVYPGAAPGQYRAQVLDPLGAPAGSPTAVPSCLAVSHGLSAAWGKDVLAVATVSEASGVMKSAICVTLMMCQ